MTPLIISVTVVLVATAWAAAGFAIYAAVQAARHVRSARSYRDRGVR